MIIKWPLCISVQMCSHHLTLLSRVNKCIVSTSRGAECLNLFLETAKTGTAIIEDKFQSEHAHEPAKTCTFWERGCHYALSIVV